MTPSDLPCNQRLQTPFELGVKFLQNQGNVGPLKPMTRLTTVFIRISLLAAALAWQPAVAAGDTPLVYEDNEIYMRLVLRTPAQLSAFYQGRQFKQAAIDKILETCFVTPIIRNKSLDVLWLELDRWTFTTDGQAITRLKRDYWPPRWQESGLPQAHQSTFGWTLMPEVRDLRLDESVGGSVVIPMQSRPFTLTANFPTGADKQGRTRTIVFEDIKCATDAD